MFAVIETGGKQYLVRKGDSLKLEKLTGEPGATIAFGPVLLLSEDQKGSKIALGQPEVKNAEVKAKIIESGKGKKVTVFKYKPKKRYRVKKGHRQQYTKVEITGIEG